ncbi:uncharacterized protein BDR25DRAFT_350466 [Lindgomyces ingoldianus]|uniref:Uncharacterized protein n=1 Tax=Lindgomyces ingoldianus TaxID=673940 RepID=A0ACB6R740_9PLEO|nr:uncharacterized protein BDR25DRAFT_350466 [Lindgomyces ingoldianus]KAF2475079.1 hypothetical protein BDR25DRAFT_350466 [Lindgomyces ingoldianus]
MASLKALTPLVNSLFRCVGVSTLEAGENSAISGISRALGLEIIWMVNLGSTCGQMPLCSRCGLEGRLSRLEEAGWPFCIDGGTETLNWLLGKRSQEDKTSFLGPCSCSHYHQPSFGILDSQEIFPRSQPRSLTAQALANHFLVFFLILGKAFWYSDLHKFSTSSKPEGYAEELRNSPYRLFDTEMSHTTIESIMDIHPSIHTSYTYTASQTFNTQTTNSKAHAIAFITLTKGRTERVKSPRSCSKARITRPTTMHYAYADEPGTLEYRLLGKNKPSVDSYSTNEPNFVMVERYALITPSLLYFLVLSSDCPPAPLFPVYARKTIAPRQARTNPLPSYKTASASYFHRSLSLFLGQGRLSLRRFSQSQYLCSMGDCYWELEGDMARNSMAKLDALDLFILVGLALESGLSMDSSRYLPVNHPYKP